MMEVLLYIWLTGWIGTGAYQHYKCETDPPKRVISKGECKTIGWVSGALWPVGVVVTAKDKLKEQESE